MRATLVLDRSGSTTVSGVISGGGSLVQEGTGTTILNGVNTYTGSTITRRAPLELGDANHPNARIAGNVTVNTGATLAGHGVIGGNVLNSGGTMAPGGSIGTLTIQGNYIQDGGDFAVEISPGAASHLDVGGTVAISNTTLALTFDPGTYSPGSFTLLHSGRLSGGFTTVTESGLPSTRVFAISQSSGDVILSIALSPLPVDSPQTANQIQVANALNNSFASATGGDIVAAHDALVTLGAAEQSRALTQMSGAIHTGTAPVAVSQATTASDMIFEHLFSDVGNDGRSIGLGTLPRLLACAESGGPFFPPLAEPVSAQGGTTSDGFWIQGGGNWTTIDGDGNAPSMSSTGGSIAAGYDARVRDDLRIGAAFAYARANNDENGTTANSSLDTYRLFGYGRYRAGQMIVGGAAGFALDRFDTERPISLGAASRTATASHDGHEVSAAIKASYLIPMQDVTLAPFLALDYISVHQEGFTEKGAGALNLAVRSSEFDSLRPEFGIRLGRDLMLSNGTTVTPEVHAGFSYELLDTAPRNSAIFIGAAAPGPFSVRGVSVDRAVAHLGGKISVHAQPQRDVFIAADAQLSGNERIGTAGLGLEYRF